MRSRVRRIVLAVALPTLAVLAVMLSGCASTEHPMHSGVGVPASEGTVSATTGDNDNTLVEVRVKHLAPPAKVASDATIYVVWIQPLNGAIQNIGGMVLDSDLVGTLKTVTPYHRFKLIVTPEPSPAVAQPTHEPVFTADVERTK
jgi:hypothetical protein